jgi:hypothetical protein
MDVAEPWSPSKIESCISGKRSVTGPHPTLLGFACLPEFLTSDGVATPIGLAQILHAVERIACDPKTVRLLPPRGFRAAAPTLSKEGVSSSLRLGALSGFHRCTTAKLFASLEPHPKMRIQTSASTPRPSEVSDPYSVFVATGSDPFHSSARGPTRLRLGLRPQGFAPSRRLAPPATCRACFIPIPLVGFYPPRPCSARRRTDLSIRRDPLGFPPRPHGRVRPSRVWHAAHSQQHGSGYSPELRAP